MDNLTYKNLEVVRAIRSCPISVSQFLNELLLVDKLSLDDLRFEIHSISGRIRGHAGGGR
jgi:hypothetical protein